MRCDTLGTSVECSCSFGDVAIRSVVACTEAYQAYYLNSREDGDRPITSIVPLSLFSCIDF